MDLSIYSKDNHMHYKLKLFWYLLNSKSIELSMMDSAHV